MERNDRDWLRLHLTPGLGRAGLIRLLKAFASTEEIFAAGRDRLLQTGIRAEAAASIPGPESEEVKHAQQALERMGARIVSLWDREYPPSLRAIHDPPALLYVCGRLPDPEALAVVGARRASPAGCRLTERICQEVASRGIAVISGLARGIDAAAHRGALAAPGVTFGILGCGIDQVYPPEHADLFHQVAERGGLLSEYPPGTQPLAGHFPGRNRIISGLAKGVLVVEATAESGSLITADFALEQGREVFAVPGAVHLATSAGVNQLLKDGAHLVTGAEDVLEVLWPESRAASGLATSAPTPPADLAGAAAEVLPLLGEEPLQVDQLARKSGLTPQNLSDILLDLELLGYAEQLPGRRYIRGRSVSPQKGNGR